MVQCEEEALTGLVKARCLLNNFTPALQMFIKDQDTPESIQPWTFTQVIDGSVLRARRTTRIPEPFDAKESRPRRESVYHGPLRAMRELEVKGPGKVPRPLRGSQGFSSRLLAVVYPEIIEGPRPTVTVVLIVVLPRSFQKWCEDHSPLQMNNAMCQRE